MFATGSHDGAVRIWTKPEMNSELARPPEGDVNADDTGNDGGGGGGLEGEGDDMQITRSPSPFEIDMERTDSPLTQTEFEAVERLRELTFTSASQLSILTAGTAQRERMVAFAEESDGQ